MSAGPTSPPERHVDTNGGRHRRSGAVEGGREALALHARSRRSAEALPAWGLGHDFRALVVNVACPGNIELGESKEGLPFRCVAENGEELDLHDSIVGMKKVLVRAKDRNANPTIARVTFDGADWPEGEVREVEACSKNGNKYDDCKKKHHDVAAILSDASFESGTDEFGEDLSEQLIVSYYATEGIFENEVRIGDDPETAWVARKKAAGAEQTLWFVARDDRGGVSWAERTVRVR